MFDSNKYKEDNDLISINKIKSLGNSKDYYDIYTIPIKYQYRPDLISLDIYGRNSGLSMQNYLTYINNIDDSPFGYYSGRIIRYIKPAYINLVSQ